MNDAVAHPPQTLTELPREMTLDEALVFATRLHRVGRFDEAEEVYAAVLEAAPEHPDALQFLGVLRYSRGQREDGIALLRRAIGLMPATANAQGAHLNLGNMLLDIGQADEATAAYELAARLGAPSAELMNNLGVLRRHEERPDEAEAAYRRALEIDPGFIAAYNNLGHLLAAKGLHEEALIEYCKALELEPTSRATRRLAALALCTLGRPEAAARLYREWLAEEPDNPLPAHYLAACTGEGVPMRASDAYVEATFDAFADSFDAKLEQLTYRAPSLVTQTVGELLGAGQGALDVLDAGCGTGLCGPLLAPWARRLVGVDLSGGMLAKAAARKVYHTLEKAELVAYLEQLPGAFDLVVSADTLCYFGPLEEATSATHAALRAGGWFVFTVEALPAAGAEGTPGYRIQHHGRYSHTRPYLETTLAAVGFEAPRISAAVLRREAGRAVNGHVVAARKPPATAPR